MIFLFSNSVASYFNIAKKLSRIYLIKIYLLLMSDKLFFLLVFSLFLSDRPIVWKFAAAASSGGNCVNRININCVISRRHCSALRRRSSGKKLFEKLNNIKNLWCGRAILKLFYDFSLLGSIYPSSPYHLTPFSLYIFFSTAVAPHVLQTDIYDVTTHESMVTLSAILKQ